jgi:hypothetical protein
MEKLLTAGFVEYQQGGGGSIRRENKSLFFRLWQ